MSVSLTYASNITVAEVLAGNTDSALAASRTVNHNQFNTSLSLTGVTPQPVSKSAFFVQALAAGVATIDLTSLTGANGASVDGTGLKVQAIKIKNLGANTMSIAPGAVNGYDGFGSDFKITLSQNQEALLNGNDATPDIGATDLSLDLAGTGTQTAEISIVMG